MSQPVVASKTPFPVDVEAGKSYWWCACGLSQRQPFCDGSHKPTTITPMKFEAQRSEKLWFCGCKQTARPAFCDGSHKQLG